MLIVNTKTDIVPSTQSMCQLLTTSNQENGLYLDYDRLLEYHFYFRNESSRIAVLLNKYINPNDTVIRPASRADILKWIGWNRIEYLFDRTDTNEISLEADSISGAINSGVLNEEQIKLLNLWSYVTSCASKVGQFGSILASNPEIEKELSCELHRMIRINPVWSSQNTHRFATKYPAIQNFVRDTQDVITVPRGYVKCDADSGQIEPRITYSTIIPDPQIREAIMQYNDAYFGLLFYNSMPEELWRSKRTDFKVPEVTQKYKEARQRLKTMGNAILYGSKDTKSGDPLYVAYQKRIGNHPMRLAYVQECTEKIMRGDYIFYTAFGEPVDVRKSANAQGKYGNASESAKLSHYIKAAFNVSMQGTAAGLMKLAVQHEYKYILRNNLKSYIMLSIHDALKTAIHEDEMDKHGEYIANIPAYQVDDWIPIHADAVFGKHRTTDIFGDKLY